MDEAITHARVIIDQRASTHPGSPLYAYAQKEMTRIETTLASKPKPDRAFYESLTHGLGLMCVKELEASDAPFCDAIYTMMESIRSQVG